MKTRHLTNICEQQTSVADLTDDCLAGFKWIYFYSVDNSIVLKPVVHILCFIPSNVLPL